ncbi:AI-2E family transporter [Tahibacter amnicola]|uniref:AI-2E family transporter n=1 Tax=Tahibacter amnicola TaxID=2976241 RepID=A0ABY6BJ02_9GAMM|nr:AI-2E family transporter [Tahibacter amnicola]UXI69993.1 AI-2E family transporter [Tahibacter amnicola]
MNGPRWWQWQWIEHESSSDATMSEVERLGRRQQRNVASLRFAAIWLTLLATLFTMFVARTLLVPILFSVFVALSINPIVSSLSRRWFPRALVAALVMLGGLCIVALVVTWVASPAYRWVERAPEAVRALAPKMRAFTEQIDAAARATQSLVTTSKDVTTEGPPVLFDVWATVAIAPKVVLAIFSVVLLVYFFLVYGESLLRRTVEISPSLTQKRNAVDIVRVMQHEMSRYLFTTTAINAGVGIGAASIATMTGIPDPLLWGVLAMVLNFIPYIGPLSMTGLFVILGLLTYTRLGAALMPAVLFAVMVIIEGQFITPMILGRRMAINPVAILLWLMILGWLWGAIGIVIAVPCLVAIKIVCERIEGWHWFSRLIG